MYGRHEKRGGGLIYSSRFDGDNPARKYLVPAYKMGRDYLYESLRQSYRRSYPQHTRDRQGFGEYKLPVFDNRGRRAFQSRNDYEVMNSESWKCDPPEVKYPGVEEPGGTRVTGTKRRDVEKYTSDIEKTPSGRQTTLDEFFDEDGNVLKQSGEINHDIPKELEDLERCESEAEHPDAGIDEIVIELYDDSVDLIEIVPDYKDYAETMDRLSHDTDLQDLEKAVDDRIEKNNLAGKKSELEDIVEGKDIDSEGLESFLDRDSMSPGSKDRLDRMRRAKKNRFKPFDFGINDTEASDNGT